MTKKQRKKDEFRKKLLEVYQNVHKNDFDVEAFIKKHQDDIDTIPLTEEEYAIIHDKFSYTHVPGKVYQPEDCSICLGEFEPEQKLLDYPECQHTYHFDCISTWLKEKMLCPYCKGTIRSSIIRTIVNGTGPRNYPNINQNVEQFRQTHDQTSQISESDVNITGGGLAVPVDITVSLNNQKTEHQNIYPGQNIFK